MKEKVGRKAVVTQCLHGHQFSIGEAIIVGSYYPESNDYLCYNENDSSDDWWLSDEEFEFTDND